MAVLGSPPYPPGWCPWGQCSPCPHLAGTLVGAHLEADGGLVQGLVCPQLGIVEVPPCPICRHALLAGELVGAHLGMRERGSRRVQG